MLARDAAHPVDVLVGARIRVLRREAGLSQKEIAHRIGVTMQQFQKYEAATNRISASKLWEIALTLHVPVADLFHGVSFDGARKIDAGHAKNIRITQHKSGGRG